MEDINLSDLIWNHTEVKIRYVLEDDETEKFLGPFTRLVAERIIAYEMSGGFWNGKRIIRASIVKWGH